MWAILIQRRIQSGLQESENVFWKIVYLGKKKMVYFKHSAVTIYMNSYKSILKGLLDVPYKFQPHKVKEKQFLKLLIRVKRSQK